MCEKSRSAERLFSACRALSSAPSLRDLAPPQAVTEGVKQRFTQPFFIETPPVTAPARRRLQALEELSKAGIFSGVLLMPVLPFLEDSAENVLSVVDSAARAGARFVYAAFGVTMRDGQRDYFLNGLDWAFPGMGERYRRRYGSRYYCSSPKAKELWELFSARCKELGLLYEMRHIISAATRGYGDRRRRRWWRDSVYRKSVGCGDPGTPFSDSIQSLAAKGFRQAELCTACGIAISKKSWYDETRRVPF